MDELDAPPTVVGAPARFGAANVLRGLAASRTGEIISLNLPLDDPNDLFGRGSFKRTMRFHNRVRPLGDGRHLVVNDDEVFLALQGSSQWDAFAHLGLIADDGKGIYFGGAGLEETYPEPSAPTLGIQALGPGVVTRGVLIDVVSALGPDREYLEADVRIGRDLIEDCLQRQHIELEAGDAVLIYTGFERRRAALGGTYPMESAGIDGTTVALWEEADVVAVIGDNPALEAMPCDYDVHIGLLRDLGIPIGELWALDRLAQACRADDRYDFLLASIPLNIAGAFGSPANAIAIR